MQLARNQENFLTVKDFSIVSKICEYCIFFIICFELIRLIVIVINRCVKRYIQKKRFKKICENFEKLPLRKLDC